MELINVKAGLINPIKGDSTLERFQTDHCEEVEEDKEDPGVGEHGGEDVHDRVEDGSKPS